MRAGWGESRPALRWVWGLGVATVATWVVAAACAPATRYRVLSFFLDGVPDPNAPKIDATANLPTTGPTSAAAASAGAAPRATLFPHKPYRDGQCAGCHDLETGQLVRPVEQGLCLNCHRNVPGDVRYVHGPVAVNACTMCHHYHASPFEKLLLKEPLPTCFRCHDREDLTPGEHHAEIEQVGCVICHDPHGGPERFFLKRTGS